MRVQQYLDITKKIYIQVMPAVYNTAELQLATGFEADFIRQLMPEESDGSVYKTFIPGSLGMCVMYLGFPNGCNKTYTFCNEKCEYLAELQDSKEWNATFSRVEIK